MKGVAEGAESAVGRDQVLQLLDRLLRLKRGEGVQQFAFLNSKNSNETYDFTGTARLVMKCCIPEW